MAKRQGLWASVYPLQGKKIEMVDSGARVSLTPKLSAYCDASWNPNWTSSWVNLVQKMSFDGGDARITSGAMPYDRVKGMVESIEGDESFSPGQGYVNCLSNEAFLVTNDDKIIFQRRPAGVHCPNVWVHEPSGYMASRDFAGEADASDPKFSTDPRLFDVEAQLKFKGDAVAKGLGISPELITIRADQDLVGCGYDTVEMYTSTTGKINADSGELVIPEGEEILFVPLGALEELIFNQPHVPRGDAAVVGEKDPAKIPLLDEGVTGLIWGFEHLTGDKLDVPETIRKLNDGGMEIEVFDTSPGKTYDFPTSF